MKLLSLALAVMLTGCATLGGPGAAADTYSKKKLVAFDTISWAGAAAFQLKADGKLSLKDQNNIVATANQAIAAIDVADVVHNGLCPAGAPATCDANNAKLTATLAILTGLQTYLLSQGAQK